MSENSSHCLFMKWNNQFLQEQVQICLDTRQFLAGEGKFFFAARMTLGSTPLLI
jgi:hypothetical protein